MWFLLYYAQFQLLVTPLVVSNITTYRSSERLFSRLLQIVVGFISSHLCRANKKRLQWEV